jgi:hypothetical protein
MLTLGRSLVPFCSPSCSTPPPQNPDSPEHPEHPRQPSTTSASASSSTFPALSDLQTQLHETQSSLATHFEKVYALEGVIAEHDAIKCEVGLLRQLVEISIPMRDGEL